MTDQTTYTTLFLDIGGVLLSNGWGHVSRGLAAEAFNLEPVEMEERHHLAMAAYESGKLTLTEYLNLVVFHQKRSFSCAQFRAFMHTQTTPVWDMIGLIQRLKAQYKLKIVAVNNESRDLNEYRIHQFHLDRFIDIFISSCFVGLRKPDVDMFRLSMDIAQATADQIIYIEDTPLFVDVAGGLGIQGILHQNYASTARALNAMGLKTESP